MQHHRITVLFNLQKKMFKPVQFCQTKKKRLEAPQRALLLWEKLLPPRTFACARGDKTGIKGRGAWCRAWPARDCQERRMERTTVREELCYAISAATRRFFASFSMFFFLPCVAWSRQTSSAARLGGSCVRGVGGLRA